MTKHRGDLEETRYYLHVDNQRRRLYGDNEQDALSTAERWAEGQDYYVTKEVRTVVHRVKHKAV